MSDIRILATLALFCSTACVPDFDTDLTVLFEPRLLAISSSPAEAGADEEVSLSALLATPEGQTPPPLSWSMCLARKPLTELGPVSPACLQPSDGSGELVHLGSGETVSAKLDKDVCKLFGPLRPSPSGGEGAGRPVDPDVTGGFYQPFTARWGDSLSLGAVRLDCDLANVDLSDAIDYRRRYRPNENPRIAAVSRRDGGSSQVLEAEAQPSVVRAGQELPLQVSWDECSTESVCGDGLCTAFEDQTSCSDDCTAARRGCSGAEPYVWYNRDSERIEQRREGITVAWFASRGRFADEQTGLAEEQASAHRVSENTYIAASEPGPATIWLVIRDSRGGQSWETRHVEVVP
jgi:hypothetical protein